MTNWTIRGEATKTAKLTESQVRQIIRAKGTLKAVAAQYGVSYGTIHSIRNGFSWRHVYDEVMADA